MGKTTPLRLTLGQRRSLEALVGQPSASAIHRILRANDLKPHLQALDRTQPMLPLRPGQVERRTHDYERHGVIDLYAALEVATGRVVGSCKESHTGQDFSTFLKRLERTLRRGELPVILDNSSMHTVCVDQVPPPHPPRSPPYACAYRRRKPLGPVDVEDCGRRAGYRCRARREPAGHRTREGAARDERIHRARIERG